ncbi:MAG: glycoside hydrolase family 88 protein [Bacteroidales bacterium]|nr:glycoside hydrolase family 88 protein [Bacteroidales bacterium]
MKKTLTAILLLSSILLVRCKEEKPFSVQLVSSEMVRNVDGVHLDGMGGKLKWNYTTGLELKAFLDVYDRYGDENIFRYVDGWYDSIIGPDGKILSYKIKNYSTDHICPGRTLFRLYDMTGKEKYRMAMDTLRKQISQHPRTSEGGFWHKMIYPDQMWLDGLYMAQPFYAEYTRRYEAPERRDSCYRDVLNHFLVVARHTYDPATGLYRHAWDESRKMFWCDPETGQSDHAWGRALGWYCMAIVDVLEIVPRETEGWNEVLGIFRGIFDTLPEYADPATGMWYQVLDQPGREGNYVEATCSAMFTYAMLKGTRLGFLDKSLHKEACRNYSRLLETFVTTGADGLVSLEHCCAVAGLGGKDNRRGDYDYYIKERICENDPKGIGPLIWASLEMERK